jgi:uncharacterized linocin/CFP29 family protein
MNGRDKIPWSADIWKRLDAAVHAELTRARIAAKFMPTVYVPAKTLTVPSDSVLIGLTTSLFSTGSSSSSSSGTTTTTGTANALSVDEGATTRINEYWVEFVMTPAQVEHEAHEEAAMAHGEGTSTGITLATRAANILAQAEDTLIFQGANALQSPLFTNLNSILNNRGGPQDLGLAEIQIGGQPSLPFPALQVIPVHKVTTVTGAPGAAYQGNTVGAVSQAFSALQALGQYGPYALVLQTTPYADAYTPLATTLITPAEPILKLVTAGFFGTSTLPPWVGTTGGGLPASVITGDPVQSVGILVSIGANTMDLVRGTLHPEHDAVVAFEQKDVNGNYRFRVVQRFALRLKDPTAVTLLEFLAT